MLMKILLSRSHPSPDVALGLVHVKHLSCFTGQGGIDLEEPFGHVWWCQGRNKTPPGIVLFNSSFPKKFCKPLVYQLIFFSYFV